VKKRKHGEAKYTVKWKSKK